ncbi:hypothetical protein D9M70_647900 [compost metagenome]
MMEVRPTGNVWRSAPLVKIMAKRYSFQAKSTCRITQETRIGLQSGSVTRQKIWPSLAPSMMAASSRSRGSPSM